VRPKLVFLSCLLVSSGFFLRAQSLSYGVQGGVLLTGSSSSSISHNENRRYTVGPLVELALPANFAVEFSPLYKRLGFSTNSNLVVTPTPAMHSGDFSPYPGTPGLPVCSGDFTCSGTVIGLPFFLPQFTVRARMNAWEFPIVGKYYFGGKSRSLRPFVLTGYSFTKSWMSETIPTLLRSPFPTEYTLSVRQSNTTTPLGVGAVFGFGVLSHKGRVGVAPEFRYTRNGVSARNQAEVLVAFRF
jgi:hypothetical protein